MMVFILLCSTHCISLVSKQFQHLSAIQVLRMRLDLAVALN
jgi:hypothetical protein